MNKVIEHIFLLLSFSWKLIEEREVAGDNCYWIIRYTFENKKTGDIKQTYVRI